MARTKNRPIATFDGEKTKLHTEEFVKEFKDGTPITSFKLVKDDGKLFFERRGKDARGNCHLWRTRAKFTQTGDVVLIGLTIDTCKGDPCSSCTVYTDTRTHNAGCRCNDSHPGVCNHSQTTIGALYGNLHGVFRTDR